MAEPLSTYTSIMLDDFMNNLGFSDVHIQERIRHMNKCSVARTLSARRIQKRDDIDRILVGSQREGIGFTYFNDLDVIQIYKFVQCLEINEQKMCKKIVFCLEDGLVPTGHFYLRLENVGTDPDNFSFLEFALIERFGKKYLSSDRFMQMNDDLFATRKGYLSKNTFYLGKKGPSLQKSVHEDPIQRFCLQQLNLSIQPMDYVRGFPCTCNTILMEWGSRPRQYDWPSMRLIEDVVALPAFVVPVGQKGTENEDLQWRVCLTLGELALLKSMNNTHIKVYVLLKLIAKHLLKPIYSDMTSFAMKNIILWQAEQQPTANFKPELLYHRLIDALLHLKACITENNLPYYMIPKRNLFVRTISKGEQESLITHLDSLIDNGPQLFLGNIEHPDDKINEFLCKLYACHILQRAEICKVSVFTTEQLTTYFERLFHYRFFINCFVYNIFTCTIPAVFKYGFSAFTDPLSIELDNKSYDNDKMLQDTENLVQWGCYVEQVVKLCPEQSEISNSNDHNGDMSSETKDDNIDESGVDSGIEQDLAASNTSDIEDQLQPMKAREETQESTEDLDQQLENTINCKKGNWSPKRKKKKRIKQNKSKKKPTSVKLNRQDSHDSQKPLEPKPGLFDFLKNTGPANEETPELLPLLDILLLMMMFHPRYTDILVILSNPSKYLGAFLYLIMWIFMFSQHCVNLILDAVYSLSLSTKKSFDKRRYQRKLGRKPKRQSKTR